MGTINRQKFIAELAKLLSFMYEEDRQTALELYEEMFDLAEDERALLNGLVSPTRQAVIVARAYDAKERKLSVLASSKDEDGYEETDEIPPYVLAIQRVSSELLNEGRRKEPARESSRRQDAAREKVIEETESPNDDYASTLRGAKKLDDTQEFVLTIEDEDIPTGEPDDVSRAMQDAPAVEKAPVEQNSEEPGHDEEEVPADETETVSVDSVLADFRRTDNTTESSETESSAPVEESPQKPLTSEDLPSEEIASAEEPSANADGEGREYPAKHPSRGASIEDMLSLQTQQAKEELQKKSEIKKEKEAEENPAVHQPAGKLVWNTPVLILFLILGIPITLALCGVILALTAGFLGAAAGLIALGGTLIVAAFSGFAVLADILLLLGGAIVALALGLLAFWMVFWMIGVLIWLIRKVIELAGVWCKKEVPEE